MNRRILPLILVASACGAPPRAPAPAAATPVAQAPTAPAASSPDDFSRTLAKLPLDDIGSLDAAFSAFERHMAGADDSAIATAVDELIEFLGRAAHRIREVKLARDPAIDDTQCELTKRCDAKEMTPLPETVAVLDELLARGVKVVYAGEGTTDLVPDEMALVKRLGNLLPPAESAYLHAVRWEADNVLWDDGMFMSSVDDIARAAWQWEAIAIDYPDSPRAAAAGERAAVLIERYLSLCTNEQVNDPPCNPIVPALIASYESFAARYPRSRYTGAVQTFVQTAKNKKLVLSLEEVERLASQTKR